MEVGQALEEAGPRRDNTAAVPQISFPLPSSTEISGAWLVT